ncbi:MAG: PDZ domain-containing protein [Gemmatimonadales bacterium]
MLLPMLLTLTAAIAPVSLPSAPLSNIQYEITFNRATAAKRSLHVAMQFDVAGAGDVVLSLPAWTPGAYEMTWFAKWVSSFTPTAGSTALRWDKVDMDTWRIRTGGARHVQVDFDYLADSFDNAMGWSRDNFAFFNGTNVLLYPEGRGFSFPATVRITTEPDWRVATGMHPTAGGGYTEKNYHDLVDMPFLVGAFDYDSAMVGSLNVRLATYPAGVLSGTAREAFWADYRRMFAPQAAVFGETPYDNYTTMMVFDSSSQGGSALEHQSSHLGLYTPEGIGQRWVSSVTAHEMFHAFNVKRLRPADMVPYRYDAPQPTPWLWVSEGITDYYADLTMVRGGIVDSVEFLGTTGGKISNVDQSTPVALEDASVTTWIHPTDGTGYLYYPKGSLAGFMLDILIRDASDNRHSLDDVMRQAYRNTYKKGLGFDAKEWWADVRLAAGRDFPGFNDRFIDGREAYPWDSVLPRAGLRLQSDTAYLPRLGIGTQVDSTGTHVTQVVPGGAAAAADMRVGDVLVSLGTITVNGEPSFQLYRETYAGKDGADLPMVVIRDGTRLTLAGKVRAVANVTTQLIADPAASPKAARIRAGIFRGTTGS